MFVRIPEPIHTVASAVDEYWRKRGESEQSRGYLGASIIGAECDRSLWYGFRWASPKQFSGRMYRLFNRGHREEQTIIEELRGIGCDVRDTDETGNQWSIKAYGGHFGGHLDAAIIGTPYAPKTWCVGEFKTHNSKSFALLLKDGVKKSKPMHYAQMQVYMGETGMHRAMYYAVCKDDDKIYTEWIEYDENEHKRLMDRAGRIINANEPPLRVSNDSTFFVCKMCDHHAICHGTAAPVPTCRSCAHSTPLLDGDDGQWMCEQEEPCPIGPERMRIGCRMHRYIPILLDKWAEYLGSEDGVNTQYRNKLTGVTFTNGDYSSAELNACENKAIIGDEVVEDFREVFGAKIAA